MVSVFLFLVCGGGVGEMEGDRLGRWVGGIVGGLVWIA